MTISVQSARNRSETLAYANDDFLHQDSPGVGRRPRSPGRSPCTVGFCKESFVRNEELQLRGIVDGRIREDTFSNELQDF